MKPYIICLLIPLFSSLAGFSAESFSHAKLDEVLSAHVRDGRVNYAALRKNQRSLNQYLTLLEKTDPAVLEAGNERFAFWINAYNAFTLRAVLDTLPNEEVDFQNYSIKKQWGIWTKKKHMVGGEMYSLDQIEHDILRPVFKDPRVHFAIVCASKGCPPLQNHAFHAETLDAELDRTTRSFANDPERVQIDRAENLVTLSFIFKWFGSDFKKADGSVASFLARHTADEARRKFFKTSDPRLKYYEYDWSLNLGTW